MVCQVGVVNREGSFAVPEDNVTNMEVILYNFNNR